MITPEEVRAFAEAEVLSTLARRYETREFSRDLWKKMAQLGLFGYLVPPEFGGSGKGTEELLQAIDAFAVGSCDMGLCLSWLDHLIIHTHVISRFGSEEQKKEFLPQLAQGDRIGALAASEPGSGADPVKMKSSAEQQNGTYRISAHKMFITNGPIADFIIVLARTGPKPGKEGISAFLMETSTPGFQVKEEMDFGYLNTSPHGELIFDDCRVPRENLLGEIGDGHVRISRAVFCWERYILLYAMAGLFRAMLDRFTREISRDSGTLEKDLLRNLATSHVTLEAIREITRQEALRAMERTALNRVLMERLLYVSHTFQQWWEGFSSMLEQTHVPQDPVFSILMKDAGLLQINGRLFAFQLERLAGTLLKEASEQKNPEV